MKTIITILFSMFFTINAFAFTQQEMAAQAQYNQAARAFDATHAAVLASPKLSKAEKDAFVPWIKKQIDGYGFRCGMNKFCMADTLNKYNNHIQKQYPEVFR